MEKVGTIIAVGPMKNTKTKVIDRGLREFRMIAGADGFKVVGRGDSELVIRLLTL